MAAFIPGESPPEVKTPIFLIVDSIKNLKFVKISIYFYFNESSVD
jgi:hypothetical protein